MHPEQKRIDFTKGNFQANGTYYIQPTGQSIIRYKILEQKGIAAMFGSSPGELFQTLKGIYDAATTWTNPGEAIHKVAMASYNQMQAIKGAAERNHPMLEICTLFINKEGEDLSTWSEDLCKAKIADWTEAGIAMEDFFTLGATFLGGYLSMLDVVESQPLPDIKSKAKQATR